MNGPATVVALLVRAGSDPMPALRERWSVDVPRAQRVVVGFGAIRLRAERVQHCAPNAHVGRRRAALCVRNEAAWNEESVEV